LFKIIKQNNYTEALSQIRIDAEKEFPISECVSKLFALDVPITASIQIIKTAYGISLAEAKALVVSHSVWKSLVKDAKPYQDDLVNHFDKFDDEENKKISSYEVHICKQIRYV